MRAGRRKWAVALSDAATLDFHGILRWTSETFGTSQALRYEATLTDAIDALTAGPKIAGARARNDLLPCLFSLHVTRGRRKGRHVLLYVACDEPARAIEVLRILHDTMDFARHLPETGENAP